MYSDTPLFWYSTLLQYRHLNHFKTNHEEISHRLADDPPEHLVTIRSEGHTVHIAGVPSELFQCLPTLQSVDTDSHVKTGRQKLQDKIRIKLIDRKEEELT